MSKDYISDPSITLRADKLSTLVFPVRSFSLLSDGSASQLVFQAAKENLLNSIDNTYRNSSDRDEFYRLIDSCFESFCVKSAASLGESTLWSALDFVADKCNNSTLFQETEKDELLRMGAPKSFQTDNLDEVLSHYCLPQFAITAINDLTAVTSRVSGDLNVTFIPLYHQMINDSVIDDFSGSKYCFKSGNIQSVLQSLKATPDEKALGVRLRNNFGWSSLPKYCSSPDVNDFTSVENNLACSIAFNEDPKANRLCTSFLGMDNLTQVARGLCKFDTNTRNLHLEATYISGSQLLGSGSVFTERYTSSSRDSNDFGNLVLGVSNIPMLNSPEEDERGRVLSVNPDSVVVFPGWCQSALHRGFRYYLVDTSKVAPQGRSSRITGFNVFSPEMENRFKLGVKYDPTSGYAENVSSGELLQLYYDTSSVASHYLGYMKTMFTPDSAKSVQVQPMASENTRKGNSRNDSKRGKPSNGKALKAEPRNPDKDSSYGDDNDSDI